MKRIMRKLTNCLLVLWILPAWLCASGNLPPLFDGEQRIIQAVHFSCPKASLATFKFVHQAIEKIRSAGVNVPLTYNERSLRINWIRTEAIKICSSIIKHSQQHVSSQIESFSAYQLLGESPQGNYRHK